MKSRTFFEPFCDNGAALRLNRESLLRAAMLTACIVATQAGCSRDPLPVDSTRQAEATVGDWNSCVRQAKPGLIIEADSSGASSVLDVDSVGAHCIEQWGTYPLSCSFPSEKMFVDHFPGKRCSEIGQIFYQRTASWEESSDTTAVRGFTCRFGKFDNYNGDLSVLNIASSYECVEKPSASNVTWSYATGSGTFTGAYTYAQSSTAPEGESDYAWYYSDDSQAEAVVGRARTLHLDTIAAAYPGRLGGGLHPMLKFCVTPRITATVNDVVFPATYWRGTTQCSSRQAISASTSPARPTSTAAADVVVSIAGQRATAAWRYTLSDTDPEGSDAATRRWYRANNDSGAGSVIIASDDACIEWNKTGTAHYACPESDRVHSLQPLDDGKYLKFCVTQMAASGTIGTEACSAWTAVDHLVSIWQNENLTFEGNSDTTGKNFAFAYEKHAVGTCFDLSTPSYLNDMLSSLYWYAPTNRRAKLLLYKDGGCAGSYVERTQAPGATYGNFVRSMTDSHGASWNDSVSSFRVIWGDTVNITNVQLAFTTSKVTGSYVFSSTQGNPDFSTVKIQRASGVNGENLRELTTESTWQLTTDEAMKYLRFCVIPFTDGQIPVCSAWTAVGPMLAIYTGNDFTGSSAVVAFQQVEDGTCINLYGGNPYSINDAAQSLQLYAGGDKVGGSLFIDGSCTGTSHAFTNVNTTFPNVSSLSSAWGSAFHRSISSIKFATNNNVSVSNVALAVDSPVITGTYTWNSALGLPQDATTVNPFYFERADNASGSNWLRVQHNQETSYALQPADELKYIRFCVAPQDTYGFYGVTKCSSYKRVGRVATLYQHGNFDGDSMVIPYENMQNGVCLNLSPYDFSDRTSSLRVNGIADYVTHLRWYYHGDCKGTTGALAAGPGLVATQSSLGSHSDEFSSVRVSWAEDGIDTSRIYMIAAKHSGRCAGVGGYANGGGATQWECWGGEDQKWTLEGAGDGYYYLKVRHSGKCLGIGNSDWGTQATQWDCLGAEDQKWALMPDGSGYYGIINKSRGTSLDVLGLSQQNGGSIVGWGYNLQDNQKWQLNPQ